MQSKESEIATIEVLSDVHKISDFYSSESELTDYLKENALEEQKQKTSTTHLLLNESGKILGYFTLLNDSIRVDKLSNDDHLEGYTYGSFPALKIGRLSTHRDFMKKGIGSDMVTLSFSYAIDIHRYSGCRMVTVDAKKGAEGFYEKIGFKKTRASKDSDTIKMYINIASFLKMQESR